MTVRFLALFTCGLSFLPLFSDAQTLQSARTVWASDIADVPALARDVDLMLRSGDLELGSIQRDGVFRGRTHERLDQYHRRVRVFGGQIVWQKESGRVLSITGKLFDNIDVDVSAALDADAAVARALAASEANAFAVGPVELVVLPLREGFALAYYLHVRGDRTLDAFFVDASRGRILLRYNDHRSQTGMIGLGVGTWDDQKKITVEQAAGTYRAVDRVRPFGIRTFDVRFNFNTWKRYAADTPAFLATDGDNEWQDGAVVDAHVYAGYTYDYYFKQHGRRGIDDKGLANINFVHIVPKSAGFNNAFYDPVDNSLNYGDGDGITFDFFSSGLDVVAHELTHAVTQFTSDLIYLNESGALNEAISDIMGASVEFFFEPAGSGRQQADWVLGEDIFINFGPIFRSFRNPDALGDPDHYDVRCVPPVCSEDFDNGGVHINSSIANHAFYLMVEGGTNRVSGIQVDGVGRAQMDRIESVFFRAFTAYLVPSSDFSDAREATLRAARELFGAGSALEQTVRQGWDAVGVR